MNTRGAMSTRSPASRASRSASDLSLPGSGRTHFKAALESPLDLFPRKLEFGPLPVPPVALPGKEESAPA